MVYQIVKTKTFERLFADFLSTASPHDKVDLAFFEGIFDEDPFDSRLKTHDVYKDLDRQIIIYSSYITAKIRLIRLLKRKTIILLHKVMTDHDYNKLRKLFRMMVGIYAE